MNFRQLSTLFLLLLMVGSLPSQNFSILTCSRGDEIYSTFGHSAIRFQDSAQGIDWVYNYGLFDFHDPNFIPKFCMGRLDYMLGKESMNDFMGQYVYQQREVKEQVLNLQPSQRDSLLRFLEWNILDENKYYRYDFLFNNCATKIIDVIEQNCKGVQMKFYEEEDKKTFRELIHANARNSVPWIDWGMDVALGMPVDKELTAREYCFLPEFVAKSIALSQNDGQSLMASETMIIQETLRVKSSWDCLTNPHNFGILILLIVVIFKFKPQTWSNLFFGMFFLILGIGGLVIGFEWFFTEHSVTKNNLNLLWLNPLFILFSYSIFTRKYWKWLYRAVIFFLTLTLVVAIFKVQDIHIASRSLVFAALIMCSVLIKNKKSDYENR